MTKQNDVIRSHENNPSREPKKQGGHLDIGNSRSLPGSGGWAREASGISNIQIFWKQLPIIYIIFRRPASGISSSAADSPDRRFKGPTIATSRSTSNQVHVIYSDLNFNVDSWIY
jgi:hypothetical protein